MAQRSGAMESYAYGSCIHYLSGTLINTSRLFFRLACSNPCVRQENFYDKTDSKGHIFQKRHTKTLVSDNAPEFCDEDLILWLEKIGCKPSKTPPIKWVGRKKGADFKNETESMFSAKRKIVFQPRLLLSYCTIPHAGRLESPSALIGRQIRCRIPQMKKCGTKKQTKNQIQKGQNVSRKKGHNTTIINREKGNSILAHADQIRPKGEYEEQNEEEISTIPSVND